MFFEDGAYHLEIYDTELSDSGQYKCTATNTMGSCDSQATLTILGKTEWEDRIKRRPRYD